MDISDAIRNFLIGVGLFLVGVVLSTAATNDDGSGVVFTGLLGIGAILMAASALHLIIILFRDLSWKGRGVLTASLIGIIGVTWGTFSWYYNDDAISARNNIQAGIVWEKFLKSEFSGKVRASALTSDGMVLFGGSYDTNTSGKDIYFGMLSQDGELIWDRVISGAKDEEITSVSILEDGGAIFTGFSASDSFGKHDGILIRISNSGEILWQKRYGGKNEDWLDKAVVLPNNDLLVAGYTASKGDLNGDGYLVRLDSEGQIIWEKTYGGENRVTLYSVVLMDSNSLMIAGSSHSNNGKNADIYYAKLDLEGEVVWENSLGYGGLDAALTMIPYANNNVLIGGTLSSEKSKKSEMFFAEIDSEGEIIASGSYGVDERNDEHIYSVSVTSNKEVLLGGFAYYDDSNLKNLALIKVDAKGNVISDHRFKPNQKGGIYSVNVLPNGEAIISGFSGVDIATNSMYVMKTNIIQ